MPDNEKQFESDIEAFLISEQGGWTRATDAGYRAHADKGLDLDTLVSFFPISRRSAMHGGNRGFLSWKVQLASGGYEKSDACSSGFFLFSGAPGCFMMSCAATASESQSCRQASGRHRGIRSWTGSMMASAAVVRMTKRPVSL